MKKLMILITFLMIASASIIAKDIVVTKDGNIIRGKVLKHSEDEVKIQIDKDNTLSFARDEIQKVEFDNNDFTLNDSKDHINNGFGSFGLAIFSPAGINFTGGYHVKSFSSRFSLGFIPTGSETLFGFQILAGYPIFANKDVFFSPSLILGYAGISGIGSGAYSGLAVDMHIHGFTASIGYGFALSGRGATFLNFDVGYKYAWND